jgi:predicted secreted protein
MSATSGRFFLLKKDGVAIAGLRENGISFDGGPVDVTSKEDSGFRTLGAFHGVKSFDLSASGVLKDDVFRDIASNPDAALLLDDVTLEYADGGEIAGDVYLASCEFAGAHDGENTYTLSLQSSEKWTWTPPST